MSDETLNTQGSEQVVETQQEQIQIDPQESQAREQGWVPKEEWQGDPEKWRPAKEFNERGELFGKIDTLGKELKETKKALRMLQDHHTKVKETEYKRAIDELKTLQKRHLEEGNSDGYLETTELLTDLKAEQKAREVIDQQKPNQVDPRFTDWVGRNGWYTANNEMRSFADSVGLQHAYENPEKTPEEVLQYVEQRVKRAYSDKFQNPNRNKPSAVEGSANGTVAKKDSFELTEDERKVMNTFIRTGALSKEQYIEELKKTRGAR